MSKSPGNCLLLLGMCPSVSVAGAKIVVLGLLRRRGEDLFFTVAEGRLVRTFYIFSC